MSKIFNVDGSCYPELHYMVDLSERLEAIGAMVDQGQYFCINRARQYGKTTILNALAEALKEHYTVISLDFQTMSHGDFASEPGFVAAFSRELLDYQENMPDSISEKLKLFSTETVPNVTLSVLFRVLMEWCRIGKKQIVLIIDEVDTAIGNQVFVDFLAQLRAYYLKRRKAPVFQSVILAGVYDIRSIKGRLRQESDHRANSPWNIAAKFRVDMSFSAEEIAGMLREYETDHHLQLDVNEISDLIYHYTSGYPYLVSALCKLMDEEVSGEEGLKGLRDAWTRQGFLESVKKLLNEQSPLFESLVGKLDDYPELKRVVYRLLFQGQTIAYNPDDPAIQAAQMFGFVKKEDSSVVIANRIFETRLYNMFLTLSKAQDSDIYAEGARQKSQFIRNGRLDMELVLKKFVDYYSIAEITMNKCCFFIVVGA